MSFDGTVNDLQLEEMSIFSFVLGNIFILEQLWLVLVNSVRAYPFGS